MARQQSPSTTKRQRPLGGARRAKVDRRLVLFDIDGTLLSAREAFRAALGEALTEVFGTEGALDRFNCSGMTDPQIVRELMREAGLAEGAIEKGLKPALDGFCRRLVARLTTGAVAAKPGAVELVFELAAVKGVTLGLVTGNLEPCARAKLALIDLNRHFPFGAYGSDHEDRARLPSLAVLRAHRHTGHRFAGKAVVVVGDAVADVRCGRGIGVRAVAVATGRTSMAELAAEGPDALLPGLGDTRAAIEAILGG